MARKSTIIDGEWYFKASSANNGTKIEIILSNKEKYSINAMCRILNIPRSLVYYNGKIKKCNTKLENAIIYLIYVYFPFNRR